MAQQLLQEHDPFDAPHQAAAPDGTACAHTDTPPPPYSLSQKPHTTVNRAELQSALNERSFKFLGNVKVSNEIAHSMLSGMRSHAILLLALVYDV
jgi:hypothetical protein